MSDLQLKICATCLTASTDIMLVCLFSSSQNTKTTLRHILVWFFQIIMGAGSYLFSFMGEREPLLKPYDTQFSERGRGCCLRLPCTDWCRQLSIDRPNCVIKKEAVRSQLWQTSLIQILRQNRRRLFCWRKHFSFIKSTSTHKRGLTQAGLEGEEGWE